MKGFRNLFLLITILIYSNIFFGPLVRATDSGLACPDWPLCHGKFIPEYTFQIAMEVGHRFYSGFIGLLILGGFLWTVFGKSQRKHLPLASILLFFLGTQVTLGALTVTKLLDPTTVNLHLLNASLLCMLSLTIVILSHWELKNTVTQEFAFSILGKKYTRYILFLVVFIAYQLFMGGRVSSHYSGLACPDFPTCYGEWFPELIGTIRYQMEHRWVGYALSIAIFIGMYFTLKSAKNRTVNLLMKAATLLIVLQITIGAFNVLYHIPKLLTAIHTTVGVLLFLVVYSALIFQIYQPNMDQTEGS
ncbi:MAG: COX15/CtaA family protein [Leptospira sp.]|nr:COX15/CtaA family protein [Leptospira sp.]